MNKYAIPIRELPQHCLDAVDAADRTLARTLVLRDGQAVAAIVPARDLERIEPPDPGTSGADPLVALAGTCRHDAFVDALLHDLGATSLWSR